MNAAADTHAQAAMPYPVGFAVDNPVHVLVLFYSRFGVLKLLAGRIEQGARSVPNVEVTVLEVDDAPLEQLRPGETQAQMHLRHAAVLD
jgi:hypothetical protein